MIFCADPKDHLRFAGVLLENLLHGMNSNSRPQTGEQVPPGKEGILYWRGLRLRAATTGIPKDEEGLGSLRSGWMV